MGLEKLAYGVIFGILAIIIVMQLFGGTAQEIANAGTNVSATGLPLSSLFSSSGLVMLIIVVGVLIAVIGLALRGVKSK